MVRLGTGARPSLGGIDASYVAVAQTLRGKWVTFDATAGEMIKDASLIEVLAVS